ncbi:hypothetical protein [Albibacterium sp.]|uniref:hypothetical protein n=1 Tax=Albibacterium sp. TaxID=2952885 RepID=UPI002C6C4DFD|nr:hypothetical protein [Albibacterium sp.]HUH18187.1 hypothetical protein [Albibacterium sp.]
MEQMNVEEVFKITIDFEADNLPKTVKIFRPLLFNEGEGFRSVLGPDLQKGIVGYGDSLDEALLDWDKNLKERIKSKNINDEVAQYVIDTLNTSVNDVW